MATRDELSLASRKKELEKIETWISKYLVSVRKNVEFLSKRGYYSDFEERFQEYLRTRDKYTYSTRNEDVVAKSFERYLYDVFYKIKEEEVGLSESAHNNLMNKSYSISSKTGDMTTHSHNKVVLLQSIAELEEKVKKYHKNKTPEQEKQEELVAIKSQLKNNTVRIPTLEKWLASFKEGYISWIEEMFAEKRMTKYDYNNRLRNVDKVVDEQRIAILSQAQREVGNLKEIHLGTVGEDGSFNGFIKGDKGMAYIQTISAGGYNIQRFHYRVLVSRYPFETLVLDTTNYKIDKLIVEVKQSYMKDVPYLARNEKRVNRISSADFVSGVEKMYVYFLNNRKMNQIFVFSGYPSLSKKEKEMFSKKLYAFSQKENRDFEILVLNKNGKPLKELGFGEELRTVETLK